METSAKILLGSTLLAWALIIGSIYFFNYM